MAQQGVDFPLKKALKADPENLISYLEITGMGCVNCGKRIQHALQKINGVSEVIIDHQSGLGQVTYAPRMASEALLIQAVHDAGNDGYHHYAARAVALKD